MSIDNLKRRFLNLMLLCKRLDKTSEITESDNRNSINFIIHKSRMDLETIGGKGTCYSAVFKIHNRMSLLNLYNDALQGELYDDMWMDPSWAVIIMNYFGVPATDNRRIFGMKHIYDLKIWLPQLSDFKINPRRYADILRSYGSGFSWVDFNVDNDTDNPFINDFIDALLRVYNTR